MQGSYHSQWDSGYPELEGWVQQELQQERQRKDMDDLDANIGPQSNGKAEI